MDIKIALAGNPNCGKTTLFNQLTGSNQYVGNWPGVTVEKKEGRLKGRKDVVIQDLPGIYSLSPYTLEEVVARSYLVNEQPDAILNIVDGTNIERNLYLTTQLIELGHPVVVAVNMIDLVRKNGDQIDLDKLGRALGCEVVEMSALKGEGGLEAAQRAVAAAQDRKNGELPHVFTGSVEHALAHIEESIQGRVDGRYLRWYAIKLFERDGKVLEEMGLDAGLTALRVSPDGWLYGLIQDGIVAGVGAVLGFVPQMLVLFLLLAVLEDVGYMARVAFIMDRIFRRFGLSGKSFIPMLVATGCGVPGIMASRTIEQDRDRKMTIMTTGFIPCGAKLPIIGLFAGAVFGESAWVAASAFFIGIAAVVVSGIMLKKCRAFAGEPAPFVMELPAYHAPSAGNVLRATCFAAMGAIKREMNNARWTAAAIAYMCVFAYAVSLIVFQLGGLVTGEAALGLGTAAALVLLAGMIYMLVRKGYKAEAGQRPQVELGCGNCAHCGGCH